MGRVVVIQRHVRGPRLFVFGQRLHHGATGCGLVAASLAHRRLRALALVGAILAAHDAHDWRVWFAREKAGELLDSLAARV